MKFRCLHCDAPLYACSIRFAETYWVVLPLLWRSALHHLRGACAS